MSEPMLCAINGADRKCPCSLVTATGGSCSMFRRPTFAEAFPYLDTTQPDIDVTPEPEETR